jgi:nicotinamide-nucleotide amidase
MIVEVINTGTELLLGEIINTSFPYLSRNLNDAGFNVLYQTTVGDNADRLLSILGIALKRADIVITTGGLGPTRGDITKEMVAKYLNLPLELSSMWMAKLGDYFKSKGSVMTENNKKQAYVPQGATVFNNEVGTAPGIGVKTTDGKIIIMLPGPPQEVEHVFTNQVMPYLRKEFAAQGVIHSRVLHMKDISESLAATLLDEEITHQTNPTIALYARKGEIVARITAKGKTLEEAKALNAQTEAKIRAKCEKYIYGVDYETLAESLGKKLKEGHYTISFAESCTGGLASSMVTDVPGSSEYLMGSVVSYSDMAKHKVLGVKQESLDKYTAVSEEVAKEMAEGVRKLFNTTLGVSITGIAGPAGGYGGKPVGLVYVAAANEKGTICTEYRFKATRSTIKLRSAMRALSMAMDKLKEL